jgi:ATP-dependent RNA circularization protein (DNA/RNA ligase family)
VASGTTTNNVKFPTEFVPITDEDNLRTKHKVLNELEGKEIYITQKMDGSSMTLIKQTDKFIVCSRRLILEPGAVMYQWIQREKINERIVNYGENLAIQGEFCGPKVNGNQLGLKDYKFYVFNIKNLDTGNFYGWEDINKICQLIKLEPVPLVDIFVCDNSWTIDKFQQVANQQIYILDSGKKIPCEGIVIRPVKPVYSNELNKLLSVKVINQNYKD